MMNRLFIIATVLSVGLGGLVIGIERIASGILAPAQAPDPFANYHTFLPGQAVQGLPLLPCPVPLSGQSVMSTTTRCRLSPHDEIVDQIDMDIRAGGISSAAFHTHHLRLGDLLALWGTPTEIQKHSPARDFAVRWDQSAYTISIRITRFRLQDSVDVTTFTVKSSG